MTEPKTFERTKKPIGRALISVSDKTGIIEFARELKKFNIEILSTGGTAKLLRDAGIKVKEVSEHTGCPELFDGRVKTLHPKIAGGILQKRDNKKHQLEAADHCIYPIDLVVCNLYPFAETIAQHNCTLEDAIENIDIGGPTMLRSAAKNNKDVTVIVDPADYRIVLDEMKDSEGHVTEQTNFRLATKVYRHTADYDNVVANYLDKKRLRGEGNSPSKEQS